MLLCLYFIHCTWSTVDINIILNIVNLIISFYFLPFSFAFALEQLVSFLKLLIYLLSATVIKLH